MNDLDQLFAKLDEGHASAAEQLWPLVYQELRQLAASKLNHEAAGQTLHPTDLVHETWLRLCGGRSVNWVGRGYFFASAAEAMRRILVERARRKKGPRQGGGRQRLELDDSVVAIIDQDHELLAVNEALDLLASEDPVKAELVKLRFFVGLGHQEAAALLGLSRATADRHWAYAKAFLYDAIYS